MPLRRVSIGTIPPDYQPPYIERKRKEIEDYLLEQHREKMFQDRMEGRDPLTDVEAFTPREKQDIAYRTDVTNAGTGAGPRNTKIQGAVIHYTGSTRDSAVNTMNSPLTKGRGYNIIIRKDGVAEQVVPIDQYTNHIRGPTSPYRTNPNYPHLNNRNTLGIAFEGTGPKDVNDAQMRTGRELLNDLNIPANNVVGHGELQGGPGGNKQLDEGRAFARSYRQSQAANEPLIGTSNPLDATSNPSAASSNPLTPVADSLGGFNYRPYETGQIGSGGVFTTEDIADVAAGNSTFFRPDFSNEGSPAGASVVAGMTPGPASDAGQPPAGTLLGTYLGLDPAASDRISKVRVPAANIKISVPQFAGPEQEMAAFGGPEGNFPAPPPPPPRTPPGMTPPLSRRRRNSFG